MKKTTKDLLKETFGSIPNNFAYREVRFHVYHALQKLEALERKETKKKQSWLEDQKREEEKRKAQPWMPPIYQTPSQMLHTLDIIDKMIEEENKVIQDIHAQNVKKRQMAPQEDNDEDDDLQTLHG
jgi:hypothetical protein